MSATTQPKLKHGTDHTALVLAGYKQTDVGVIPSDWEVCRLDTLGSGSTPSVKAGPFGSSVTKDTYVLMGYKVYGQEQVIRRDHTFGDYFITQRKYQELESCAVRPGDVLLTLVGTVGKLLEIPEGAPAGIINPRLIRFSFDKRRVLPTFFQYLFESDQVQALLIRKAQGGTMGVLNAGALRPFCIQLPPPPEQRAIAEALSDVDGLLGALEALIAKKRAIKQAAMQQLLTGKSRLPGFSRDWETKLLGEIGATYGGLTSKSKADFGAGDARYVTFLNVLENVVLNNQQFEHVRVEPGESQNPVHMGDLLFNGTSETPGDLAMGAVMGKHYENLYLNSFCFGFRIHNQREYLPLFFAYYFRGVPGRSLMYALAQGATRYNMSKTQFLALALSVPQPEEQAAIASVLSDMDAEVVALDRLRDKVRAIKQGMMQQLLTGRVRLVNTRKLADD